MEEKQVGIRCIQLRELVLDVACSLGECHWLDLGAVGPAATTWDPGRHKDVLAPDLRNLRRKVRAIAVSVEGLDACALAGDLEPPSKLRATHDHHRHGAAASELVPKAAVVRLPPEDRLFRSVAGKAEALGSIGLYEVQLDLEAARAPILASTDSLAETRRVLDDKRLTLQVRERETEAALEEPSTHD